MLRFVLAIILIAVFIRISQKNVYIGFALYSSIILIFILYTINSVDHEEIELEREMLRTPYNRRRYYTIINSI